eukprot:847863-Alexandrium_andersonii.AAC.1
MQDDCCAAIGPATVVAARRVLNLSFLLMRVLGNLSGLQMPSFGASRFLLFLIDRHMADRVFEFTNIA